MWSFVHLTINVRVLLTSWPAADLIHVIQRQNHLCYSYAWNASPALQRAEPNEENPQRQVTTYMYSTIQMCSTSYSQRFRDLVRGRLISVSYIHIYITQFFFGSGQRHSRLNYNRVMKFWCWTNIGFVLPVISPVSMSLSRLKFSSERM